MKAQVALYEGRISRETSKRLENIQEIGKIHSIFQHTLNIVLNIQLPNLITLGDDRLLGSPNSVSIDGFQQLLATLPDNASCLLLPHRIYIDTHAIIQLKVDTQSEAETLLVEKGVFSNEGLTSENDYRCYLEQHLAKHNPYLSNPSYFPFFQQVKVEGAALVAAIMARNWVEVKYHGRRLIGLGVGLTPSGDDYLTGLLLTLNQKALLKQNVNEAIFGNGQQLLEKTNVISQHQLYFAKAGEGKASVLNLITGIKQKRLKACELQTAIAEVLSIGSTSGYDMLLGVLAGLTILTRSEEKIE